MDLTALIKAALVKAGLPEDLHEQIKAEKEDEIDGLVEEFKKTYVPPTKLTLAELLKDETLKAELDEYTTNIMGPEVDRRATQALKTYEEKLKGKGPGLEESTEMKELKGLVEKLTESVTGQAAAQKVQQLRTLAVAALVKAGLPESWIDRVVVKEEAEIEGSIKGLSEEFTKIKQDVFDQALKENPIPGLTFGKVPGQATGAINEFVKDLGTEQSAKVEKLE